MWRIDSSSDLKTRDLVFIGKNVVTYQKGFFYVTGRDTKYRPVIVVNVPKIIDANLKEKTFFAETSTSVGDFFSFPNWQWKQIWD